MAFCLGSYLARPKEFLILNLDLFFGTGTLMTSCVAKSFSEKLAITLRLIEHLIRIGQVTCEICSILQNVRPKCHYTHLV